MTSNKFANQIKRGLVDLFFSFISGAPQMQQLTALLRIPSTTLLTAFLSADVFIGSRLYLSSIDILHLLRYGTFSYHFSFYFHSISISESPSPKMAVIFHQSHIIGEGDSEIAGSLRACLSRGGGASITAIKQPCLRQNAEGNRGKVLCVRLFAEGNEQKGPCVRHFAEGNEQKRRKFCK